MFDKEIQTSIELGVDLMKDIVAAGYSFSREKNRERDFFDAATKKYVGGLIERYNNVKVLGMREPVPLKSLYVRANILEKISARAGLRPEDLETYFDRDRRTFGKTTEPVDGEIIANRLQKFIVLGKPGAGKTTYLRFLTLMMLDPASGIEKQNRRLPIFVNLHDWAQKALPLMDYLTEQFNICGFEEARPFVERMLAQGSRLVLFDGLDEVSREADQEGIIRQTQDFTDKYTDNQFIISCRVAAYNHCFERFTDVEMADFNDAQIETFIRNWFRGQPKVASECWERLKASPRLRELASVPLLLTLLCLAYNTEKNEFPQKRSSIYRDAIKILLEHWDESRPGGRVKRDNIYKNLSRQNKEAMFARIAWGTFTENQYFIEEEKLARMIQNFIKSLPEYQDEKVLPDGERILKQIEAQHGILVERAKGVYSFSHLTFQEYFTAKYIVDNVHEETLEGLVNDHLYENRYKEVFLLVAEILDNVDVLVLLIQKKNQNLKNDINVDRITDLANQTITNSDNYFWKVYMRIIVMNMLLQHEKGEEISSDELQKLLKEEPSNWYFNLTEEEFKDFQHSLYEEGELIQITYDISQLLDSYMIETLTKEKEVYGSFTGAPLELIKTLKSSFYLQGSLNDLFLFLQTIELMINILKSDTYVSKPVREKILNEMLMPGKEGE